MRIIFLTSLIFILASCTLPEEKRVRETPQPEAATTMHSNENYTASLDTSALKLVPAPQKIRNPSGIYQTTMSFQDSRLEQTVAFYKNHTYRLKEKYSRGKNDSVVVTEGNWLPRATDSNHIAIIRLFIRLGAWV